MNTYIRGHIFQTAEMLSVSALTSKKDLLQVFAGGTTQNH